jgi:hypothetical protein
MCFPSGGKAFALPPRWQQHQSERSVGRAFRRVTEPLAGQIRGQECLWPDCQHGTIDVVAVDGQNFARSESGRYAQPRRRSSRYQRHAPSADASTSRGGSAAPIGGCGRSAQRKRRSRKIGWSSRPSWLIHLPRFEATPGCQRGLP